MGLLADKIIFQAGLLSAALTPFVADSYHFLQEDPTQT